MSKYRHPDTSVAIRSFGVTFRSAQSLPANLRETPGWHQLIYATRGVMTVLTEESAWVTPPHRAVWIPDGCRFRVETSGETAIRSLYLTARKRWVTRHCAVVNVTPLLRELIVKANAIGALDSAIPQQRRLIGVIQDELKLLQSVPLQLPWPKDRRAKEFAAKATAAGGKLSTAEVMRQTGASRRTLERIFAAETGMSLGRWMRRQKLLEALKQVAAGEAIKTVASRLGYNSASAFVAMFRRELGETPKRYFAQ